MTHEVIARRFHEAYEYLAPSFSYKTGKATAVPWNKVPAQNKALMIATVAAVFPSFESVNDFMVYTHDSLDMHRGLVIPGCIYCNGDM